jgi:RNA polymerase-binding transcription factor DksA
MQRRDESMDAGRTFVEQLREALERREFGICPDCGVPISAARLRANPAALRCTDCQAHHEKVFAEAR